MAKQIQLRETVLDDQTVVFSLTVSRARAPAMRRYLEGLLGLLTIEEPGWEGQTQAREELPSQALKRLRLSRGMSQKTLAEYLGVSQGRISDFEQGVKFIPLETAQQLATLFQVGAHVFIR